MRPSPAWPPSRATSTCRSWSTIPKGGWGSKTGCPSGGPRLPGCVGPDRSVEVVVSRFAALGDFDTLDRMLADAPNAAHAVLVPLPCGCRLVAGALGIVAGTMAGQRSPSIVEGLAGTFDPSGVMIGLGFGAARSTWDLIGAVADCTRDGRDLPGGLFWRADLWHRLGRMDPTLTYAGYLDFRSKAAVHGRGRADRGRSGRGSPQGVEGRGCRPAAGGDRPGSGEGGAPAGPAERAHHRRRRRRRRSRGRRSPSPTMAGAEPGGGGRRPAAWTRSGGRRLSRGSGTVKGPIPKGGCPDASAGRRAGAPRSASRRGGGATVSP